MSTFAYQAVDRLGKEQKGSITADNMDTAIQEVKKKGLTIISINDPGALGRDINLGFLDPKPKPRDLAVFCRQFVSLLDAGVSVIASLDMLSEQTENKKLRYAISQTKHSIETGDSLADAMRPHANIYTDLFITLIAAGEASGSIDVSLTRMAEQFEKAARLKALIKKATIYPIVVAVMAVVVVIAMLTFIIPTFQTMFDDIGTELPGITKAVVAASDFLVNYWYVVLGVVAGVAAAVYLFKKSDFGSRFIAKTSMKAPLFGRLTLKQSSARLARTMSTLLGSGIPLIEALDITSRTMSNVLFREALQDAKDDVAVGSPVSESIESCGLFPPLMHHMLRIGEETGNMEGMLSKLAGYYEEEVEQATQQLTAALEPMIIIVMAGIIGFLVLSIILPMTKMYEGLDSLRAPLEAFLATL